jgi:hypothetical protein
MHVIKGEGSMRIARLAGLLLGSILAMSLVGASVASATLPEFRSGGVGTSFLALSLVTHLTVASTPTSSTSVRCSHDKFEGVIANIHLVGPFSIHFLECESSSDGIHFCALNSVGTAGSGLVVTRLLHGLLGLVLPNELIGLLVLPTESAIFVRLASNACTPEIEVTGTVAGLLTPTLVLTLEQLLTFKPNDIRLIHTLNGLVEPLLLLTLLGQRVVGLLESVEHIQWHDDIEVT